MASVSAITAVAPLQVLPQGVGPSTLVVPGVHQVEELAGRKAHERLRGQAGTVLPHNLLRAHARSSARHRSSPCAFPWSALTPSPALSAAFRFRPSTIRRAARALSSALALSQRALFAFWLEASRSSGVILAALALPPALATSIRVCICLDNTPFRAGTQVFSRPSTFPLTCVLVGTIFPT